jgi:elongation factor G
MGVPVEKKRNIALIGHGGAGKTILAEAMLFMAGATSRMGTIEDGNTVSDHDPEEIRRKYSIHSSVLPFTYKDHAITVVDCPGYLDFIGETTSALNAVDSAIIVVNGSTGVEPQTRQAWALCEKLSLPRLIYISGLDKENASWTNALASCRSAFGKTVAPLFVTVGEHHSLRGVINVLIERAYIREGDKVVEQEIPDDYKEAAAEARASLVESIVELDEAMFERYLADDSISTEELLHTMQEGIAHGQFCPAVGGSAKQIIGVRSTLDLVLAAMPAPNFKGTITGAKPNGSEEVRQLSESAPLCARIFKISQEGQLGEVFWMRIFSGTLKPGEAVFNANSGEMEKVSNLLIMRGKTREDMSQASVGDLVATVKLKSTHMGNTLSTKESPIVLPPIEYPTSVSYECVEVEDKNDLEKVISAIHHYSEMDPTLRLVQDKETKEQVLYGMGQLHLDVVAAYIKGKANTKPVWKKPRVPYRETITSAANAQGRYKKQTGGRGKFGDVHIKLEPQERGIGYEFVDAVVGGVVPHRFIPAVEKGVADTMDHGPLSGSRVIDVKVTLYDGSSHPVDSDELSFKVAASMGFKQAFEKASPIILEPIYKVTVYTPEPFMGDVMADVNTRRGRIAGMDQFGDMKQVTAEVPLGELYQYINTLRSITQGQGYYQMEFSRYEQVPSNVQSDIVKHYAATRTVVEDH